MEGNKRPTYSESYVMTQKYLVGLEKLDRNYSSFPAYLIKSRRLQEIVFSQKMLGNSTGQLECLMLFLFFNWTSA